MIVPDVRITAGDYKLLACFERTTAPMTCYFFESILPFCEKLIHVRWSGEAVWTPLGSLSSSLPPENATSHPAPGQILFYPGGLSEAELLIAYGGVQFASKLGQLAGNHFMTIVDGVEHLRDLGGDTLWSGAQAILIERI